MSLKSSDHSRLEKIGKTMKQAILEHLNFTVTDVDKTAEILSQLFGWEIRWQGSSIHGGRSIHVGNDQQYLALYTNERVGSHNVNSYESKGGLNHLGVIVDDLDSVEEKVLAAGFTTKNHDDYDPGRRFYFDDHDGIEFEVVSYT